jgi:hypothetical protein
VRAFGLGEGQGIQGFAARALDCGFRCLVWLFLPGTHRNLNHAAIGNNLRASRPKINLP